MRSRTYHVLCGAVLAVWRIVENILSVEFGNKLKIQVVRLKTSDGGKLVGLLIPSSCVPGLIEQLTTCDDVTNIDERLHHVIRDSTTSELFDDAANFVDDSADEYEDVDEVEPDEMLSGVLVPGKQLDFWSR